MTAEDQLKGICAARRIGIYFSNTERNRGKPWIFLKSRGLTIAEFYTADDALAWLPQQNFQPERTSCTTP